MIKESATFRIKQGLLLSISAVGACVAAIPVAALRFRFEKNGQPMIG